MEKFRKPTSIAALIAARQLHTLTGRAHALLCGRASAAIQAALTVIGAAGRPVLMPANTCYIVLWAVIRAGAHPYLVDIDPTTGNMTAETLTAAEKISGHPAAIIPCHLYGIPAPMRAITAWAREHHVFIIEDSALALGIDADDRPVGGWGDVSVCSFGAGKIVDVELGGALLTDDAALADALKTVLNHYPVWNARLATLSDQWRDLYWALQRFETATPALSTMYPRLFDLYGETTAYRLPATFWHDLPDALDGLSDNIARRRALAELYKPHPPTHFPNREGEKGTMVASDTLWRYPVFVDPARREVLLRALWAGGFHDVTCWYPSLQPMRAALCPDSAVTPTPHADLWGASVINLPMDARVTPEQIAGMMAIIHAFE